jgi:hypothetical protein
MWFTKLAEMKRRAIPIECGVRHPRYSRTGQVIG